jgi:hypothetical protein
MGLVLEVGSTNYADDLLSIKKSLSHIETLVGSYNGYTISKSTSKFGWTFFKLAFNADLQNAIEEKFSDMIYNYQSNDPSQKFAKFISDYFNSKDCKVKIKITD